MEFEVNDDDLGIYPLYEVLYIECILSATESAINSWEEIQLILSDSKLFKEFGLKTIDLSENIVNQAGIISKYYDPPNKLKIHQLRAKQLRENYKIEDSNILLNRKFRNHIEHFDEKLDNFLKSSMAGVVFPTKSPQLFEEFFKKMKVL
jgi:histidinol phosphatase-like enzyme